MATAAAKSVLLLGSSSGFCVTDRYKDKYLEVQKALTKAVEAANSKISSNKKIESIRVLDVGCSETAIKLRQSLMLDRPDFVFVWSTTGVELSGLESLRKEFPDNPIVGFRSAIVDRGTRAVTEAINVWLEIPEYGLKDYEKRELFEDKFFLRLQEAPASRSTIK